MEITNDTQLPFIVRTIYFQPVDAPPATDRIAQLMIDVQNLYRTKMERNGYGAKTFRLETDENGNHFAHIINGKHNIAYYGEPKTSEKIRDELPSALNKTNNNIHVVIVGGLKYVNNSVLGVGWGSVGKNCGGWAFISTESGRFRMRLIAHEIGHAFGLYHSITGDTSIMKSGSELHDYEARWLDRHRYFNTFQSTSYGVKISDVIIDTQQSIITFRFDVESIHELHQAQILKEPSTDILAWKRLKGKRDTIDFRIGRSALVDASRIQVLIMDTQGNINLTPVSRPQWMG